MKVRIEDIKLKPSILKDNIPMSNEEFEGLKLDIKENGLKYPIVLNQSLELIDGYHRYKACKELGFIEIDAEIRNFSDEDEEQAFFFQSQLRRNLLPIQKVRLGLKMLELEKKKAKERQGMRTDLTSGSFEPEVGSASEIVAKKLGISHATFKRAVKVLTEAPEPTLNKVLTGEISILEAYNRTIAYLKIDDEEKRDMLIAEVEEGEISTKELMRIVNKTQAFYELLENLPEEGREELMKKHGSKLWTKELNLEEVKLDIQRKYSPSQMVTLIFDTDKIKDSIEAKEIANKCRGNFKGMNTLWIFEIPLDYEDKIVEMLGMPIARKEKDSKLRTYIERQLTDYEHS